MEYSNLHNIDSELNLSFEEYAQKLTNNYGEQGFSVPNVQAVLGESPVGVEVKEDLEYLVQVDVLEKEELSGTQKRNPSYSINFDKLKPLLETINSTRTVTHEGEEYKVRNDDRTVEIKWPDGSKSEPFLSTDIAETIVDRIDEKIDYLL